LAGSCIRQKGVEDLIEALALVRDLPLLLDLAGPRDIEPGFNRRLMKLIKAHHLTDRVTFHGLVNSQTLARLYASADILIFPSHYEDAAWSSGSRSVSSHSCELAFCVPALEIHHAGSAFEVPVLAGINSGEGGVSWAD
jgi:glycosyltransferase involved in cell wall biosynthesis